MLPDVLVPAFDTILSAVRELVAPEMILALKRLFAPISIPPVMVPPALGRYISATVSLSAKSVTSLPLSWITLSELNTTTLLTGPVPMFETMLLAVREFVEPEMVPTFVMLFVPIAMAPAIVPPARGRNAPPEAIPTVTELAPGVSVTPAPAMSPLVPRFGPVP